MPLRWSTPVDALRAGWRTHVAFGLDNPSSYTLMYGRTRTRSRPDGAKEAEARLRALLSDAARDGRLQVDVDVAVDAVLAANIGVTLALLQRPEDERDLAVSEILLEAAVNRLVTTAPERQGEEEPAAWRRAAVTLTTQTETSDGLPSLTAEEQSLLRQWLDRARR